MNKKVKIITILGKILTIEILKQTETQIIRKDKFDVPVIIPYSEIKSMTPITERENGK